MRRRRPALFVVVLIALGAIPAATPALGAGAPGTRHDRIVRHWTPERLAAATPRDFVRSSNGLQAKARPGSGSGTVTGASWTKGGAILKASGKVYFEMGSSGYVCSGSVARDGRTGYSLVLTAAHCAFDESSGEFARNWLFIPEFDTAPTFTCAQTVHGCWTADALVVHRGYATAGAFNEQATVHDYAFAVVAGGGKSGSAQLDATVGSFGIAFSGVAAGHTLYAFGYPAAGKYKGKDLTYCAGPISTDGMNDHLTWSMACDMTGGSSGGPWLSSFTESSGDGALSSLNSYGYSGVRNMYGPKFDVTTQSVYDAADRATSDTVVGP